MDWYPWYPTDFRRKTYSLSLAEDGAYRRLIDEYMIAREPLPADDLALARILGVTLAEWGAVAIRVRSFFKERDGLLIHTRCEEEVRRQDAKFAQNSARGQKAAIKRWSKNNKQHARRMLTPNTLHYKERKKEGGDLPEPAGSLATALPSGALASQPTTDASPFLLMALQRKGWAQ